MLESALVDQVRQVMMDAAAQLRHPCEGLSVQHKSSPQDLVTQYDKLIEEFLACRLTGLTGYPVLGEESHAIASFDGHVWVIDPIDGTTNFIHTRRDYAISVALCCDGKPMLGMVFDVAANKLYEGIAGRGAWCNSEPMAPVVSPPSLGEAIVICDVKELNALPRLNEMVTGTRGHRRYGSAALECVAVAMGQASVFVHLLVHPWDVAGAYVIGREVGIEFVTLEGAPFDIRYSGSIIAAPGPLAQHVAAIING